MPYLWISLGAIVGANLRYVVTRWSAQTFGTAFPLGTFFVNVAGCLVIGLIATVIAARLVPRPEVTRLLVIVGFLGSLTTFSSFAYETHSLMNDGEWLRAGLNVVLSVVAGLVGVRIGVYVAPYLGGAL